MEMVLVESDFDDEIEILSVFAMKEEQLKRERASTSCHSLVLGRKVIRIFGCSLMTLHTLSFEENQVSNPFSPIVCNL
jgi:hypothetical protein